ncbi:MAG: lipopolysaccharide heptosyltransferase II [Thermodesulfobacteriota bacterium]
MRPLDTGRPRRVLVRGVNWVGDAVMTLPALTALGRACPQAEIAVLAKPLAAPVYRACPAVGRIMLIDPARHAGAAGLPRLAGELRAEGFDWAVLMQNAFGAALTAWLARVPVRLGYARDGRGLLLTHAAPCGPKVRRAHETAYYLHLLHAAGLAPEPPAEGVRPGLTLAEADQAWAAGFLAGERLGDGPLLGLAPGAAFGPAKCWPAERFAAAAGQILRNGFGAALLFGGPGETAATAAVAAGLPGRRVVDLAGRTSLGQALALLARLALFITNDSGLMHAAAALGAPTLAVFGSTNPDATGPLGPWVQIVRRPVDCAPCKKPVCPTGDLRCFAGVGADEVAAAGLALWRRSRGEARA